MEKVHFTIDGSFITNIAREKLFCDKKLREAVELLKNATVSDELSSDEHFLLCLKILNGDASIVGNSGSDDYGIEYRSDIDKCPADFSSIFQLVEDMADEIKRLKEAENDAQLKISILCDLMDEYDIRQANDCYYEETGKPMFQDIAVSPLAAAGKETNEPGNEMLASYLTQRQREREADEKGEEVCDYGWLEPDGTFHPVEWGRHSEWACKWLDDHMPFKDNPKIYWWTGPDGKRHSIVGTDVLIRSLGWILLDSPHHGQAKVTRDTERNMTNAQKEFLYDYFMERGRINEAFLLFED